MGWLSVSRMGAKQSASEGGNFQRLQKSREFVSDGVGVGYVIIVRVPRRIEADFSFHTSNGRFATLGGIYELGSLGEKFI